MNHDNPSPAAPANPPPPAPKPRAKRGPINKKYLDEHSLCEDLIAAIAKDQRAAALAAAEWDAARVTAFTGLTHQLETAALAAIGRVKARPLDTAAEEAAKARMWKAIHPVRVGAKRKYRNGPDAAAGRSAFFVNEPTDVSLERLLFMAGQMHTRLTPQAPATVPEDTLPGVTAAVIAELTAARAAFVEADDEQAEATSAKNQAYVDVEAAYAAVHKERIDLQLAADQTFPHYDPANSAIRRDFHLPPDRPAVE